MRKLAPLPALCGFLLSLVLIFVTSYAVGAAFRPAAYGGAHETDRNPGGSDGGGGTGGVHDGGHGDGRGDSHGTGHGAGHGAGHGTGHGAGH
ncbi:hypothetical protein ACVW19_003829 [Streptomyces sp. TE5632]